MFDSHNFFKISKNIESDDRAVKDEALRRTAVSRAYYGAYLLANNHVNDTLDETSGVSARGNGGHQKFWAFFDKVDKLKELEISDDGFRLLDKRKEADYNLKVIISKADVKAANKLADRIIKRLDEVS